MPADLSPTAQAFWNRTSEELRRAGLISRVDGDALRLLCESWAIYLEASDLIARDGITITDTTAAGGKRIRANPAVSIRNRAWAEIVSLLKRFGMTPQSRAGIPVGVPSLPDSSEGDRINGILKLHP